MTPPDQFITARGAAAELAGISQLGAGPRCAADTITGWELGAGDGESA